MFIESEDYIELEPDERYRMLRDYSHTWLEGTPAVGNLTIGRKNVTYTANELILHAGYEWNGSDQVKDTPQCMRASAVHDAWCWAMNAGIYVNDRKNWNRGAKEYAAIGSADGLSDARARGKAIRWFGRCGRY